MRTAGDAFFLVFGSAPGAIAAVSEAQRALAAHAWPSGYPVRVRIGLHTGDAPLSGDDYGGLEVHRAARVAATGHGGQVVLSDATRVLVEGHLPEGVTLRSLGAHRLKDLLAPEPLWQLVIPGLPADFPPLKTLERHPHRLPLMPTGFLGRETDIDRLGELLERHRLVTLTGPGGTGKTRLALQAAAEHIERYPDGAFFVGLAALADAELVMSAVASALGVRESAGQSLAGSVAEYLRDKALLLVIDNLEHLPGAAPRISELLAGAPALRVLATSRSPLHLGGEQEYPVAPMGLPDPGERDPERLAQSESVRLFTERAALVDPAFSLTARDAGAVAALVTRLDGLPLAIELAAARTKLLSPGAILARLEKRLPALAQGAADAPARQRTLAATIAWSHDLLSPPEQALFRRFSVFSGGATLEALEAVADPDGELGDTLELVGALVDHSLLRRISSPDGETRLRMLTVLREDAERRLAEAGEADATRERHARWCLALAEEAEPQLTGADQVTWLDRLETEHDNIRAALAWALEEGQGQAERAEVGLRMAGALWRFWQQRAQAREGKRWIESCLRSAPSAADAVVAKACNGLGALGWSQGEYELARDMFHRHLVLRRRLGDPRGIAGATNNLAVVSQDMGDAQGAERLYAESLANFRMIGYELGISRALGNLGTLALEQERLSKALELFQESLAVSRRLRDTSGIAATLINLATVYYDQGKPEKCAGSLHEVAVLLEDLDDHELLARLLDTLSELCAETGRMREATRLVAAACGVRATAGDALSPYDQSRQDRHITVLRERIDEPGWQRAWDGGSSLEAPQALAEARRLLGAFAKAPPCMGTISGGRSQAS